MPIRNRALAAVLALLILSPAAAACGDDDSTTAGADAATESTTSAAPESTITTTEAPSATTTTAVGAEAASFEPGTPEAGAAAAYAIVFDSTATFDQKAAHLADADALQATVEAYGAAGQSFGGIKLTPTAITVTGATAAVTYDVYFGTARQYDGLDGSIELSDGTWVVSRDEFCGFMSSARTPCAA